MTHADSKQDLHIQSIISQTLLLAYSWSSSATALIWKQLVKYERLY